jgi:glucose/arabinose dehydrogenase
MNLVVSRFKLLLILLTFIIVFLIVAIIVYPIIFREIPRKNNEYSYEIVVSNLDTPWSLAFDKNGKLFFTERPGKVKVFYEGKLIELKVNINVKEIGEGGLLGLALHPDFPNLPYIYLYYTYQENDRIWNRVSMFKLVNDSLIEEKILVDKIPGASIHDGGRIKFGPDKKLYITTGDAAQPNLAQDLNSLAGKILRINPNGSIPQDNPFASIIYSYGHRNPQGIDWNGNIMYESEHGPSGEKGFAHDEINVIIAGGNYGWPLIVGGGNDNNYINPILESGSDTWAPSGIVFYKGDVYPELKGKLLVACLRGEQVLVVDFDKNNPKKVVNYYTILSKTLGRIRDIAVDKEGYIYLATSNMDGRGTPKQDDDKIVKLKPNIKSQISLISYFKDIYISINDYMIIKLRRYYNSFIENYYTKIISLIY